MSKIKFSKALANAKESTFSDLCRKGGMLCNLRPMPDGSLVRREGYEVLKTFSQIIRAHWKGNLSGSSCEFILAGKALYRLFADGTAALLYTLQEDPGRAKFVLYGGKLYLFSGHEVLICNENQSAFREAYGYAPLFGKNWHPTDYGDTYQPLNLFSKRVRVHYLNTTGATTFRLPFYAASIDCLRVDHQAVYNFTFTPGSDEFTIPAAGGEVEVGFTLSYPDAQRAQILSCTLAKVLVRGADEELYLSGALPEYRLFSATQMSTHDITSCLSYYPDCDGLYIESRGSLEIGSHQNPIQGMVRQDDRLMVFTKEDAWSVTGAADNTFAEAYRIPGLPGCAAPNGVLENGDHPILLTAQGLAVLDPVSSVPDCFELRKLSNEISPTRVDEGSFWEHAILFFDPYRREIWMRDPEEDYEGTVWIYSVDRNLWFTFDNFWAQGFYLRDGMIAFAAGTQLCLCRQESSTDHGAVIKAFLTTPPLSLSCPETVKRNLRVSFSTGGETEAVKATIRTEGRLLERLLSKNGTQSLPKQWDLRLSPGRFHRFVLTLTVSSVTAAHLYGITFAAN